MQSTAFGKPRVERSFYELTLSFFRGRSFHDVDDLRAQLARWLDTICDGRPIKRCRRKSRMELFGEEQSLLRPLPRHPYDTARLAYRPCDIEGFITWEGNRYSLPYDHVTDLLPLRVTQRELCVYRPDDLTLIACHGLLPRGAQLDSVLDGHRPRHAERGPDLDQLRAAYDAMDAPAAEFLAGLEQALPRSAGYHARRVLALRGQWSTEDLCKALAHARAYGAFEHQAVERILLVRATPRRLEEYASASLAQRLEERVTTRRLSDYDALPVVGAPQPRGDARPCPDESPLALPSPTTSSGPTSSST